LKCVHQTSDRTAAHLLRSALAAEGVEAIVQGEHLFSLQGELPAGFAFELRVCIVDDEQLPKAVRLTAEWLRQRSGPPAGEPWVCAACGERHEPQFETCWRCGAERES
jgi:hypothetical protein